MLDHFVGHKDAFGIKRGDLKGVESSVGRLCAKKTEKNRLTRLMISEAVRLLQCWVGEMYKIIVEKNAVTG